MRAITRTTPMLRGVTVVLGGQTAWMRLGFGYRVAGETPTFPISMRHPSPSSSGLNQPNERPNHVAECDVDRAASRAGRSDCFAGVLVRRSPALRASLVGGRSQGLQTWSPGAGGLSLPNATRTGKRLKAQSVRLARAGRARFAAAPRGRGVA
jgi:hypothetical protein